MDREGESRHLVAGLNSLNHRAPPDAVWTASYMAVVFFGVRSHRTTVLDILRRLGAKPNDGLVYHNRISAATGRPAYGYSMEIVMAVALYIYLRHDHRVSPSAALGAAHLAMIGWGDFGHGDCLVKRNWKGRNTWERRLEPPERSVARIMLRREWETIRHRFADDDREYVEERERRMIETMLEAVKWGIAFLEPSIRQ